MTLTYLWSEISGKNINQDAWQKLLGSLFATCDFNILVCFFG